MLEENIFQWQIKILKNLVKINSANIFTERLLEDSPYTPIERDVANYIRDLLSDLGYSPKLIGISEFRPNVYCKIAEGDPKLIFNAHMDTVTPAKGWAQDPFTPVIRNNKLYGLGAVDNKSAISIMLLIAKLWDKIETNAGLELHFTVGEEVAGSHIFGSLYLTQRLNTKADFCICFEPGTKGIRVGNMGFFRFMIETKGKAVHTGFSAWIKHGKGENAIVKMAEIAKRLGRIILPGEDPLFEHRRSCITFPTLIQGGSAINIVPDKCVAFGDARLLPIHTKEDVIKEIEKRLEGIDYKLTEIRYLPGWKIDPNNKYVRLLQKVASERLGFIPSINGVGPASEAYAYVSRGIPTVNFGPDGKAHIPNEFVDLESLRKVDEIILDFLKTV